VLRVGTLKRQVKDDNAEPSGRSKGSLVRPSKREHIATDLDGQDVVSPQVGITRDWRAANCHHITDPKGEKRLSFLRRQGELGGVLP
jgi:hypothetical protein